jgi:predicted DNA-binding protein (MmcQ/YjbR family)
MYAAVRPGYHANKRHWNTVKDAELREMIDHTYELVVSRLPRSERARLVGR